MSVLKYLIHDNEYFRPFLFKNLPLGPNTLNYVPQTSMLYPHKKLILLEVNEVQEVDKIQGKLITHY